jgi:alkaline phosphatase
MALTLTTDERTELERRASSRTIRAEDAKRAKVILMLADGTSYSTIEATLWCYRDYINRWRQRGQASGWSRVNHSTIFDYVAPIDNLERVVHVVIGKQHAEALRA